MIDIDSYRWRIGCYHPGKKCNLGGTDKYKMSRNKFRSCGFYIRGGLGLSPSGSITWYETIDFRACDNVGLKLGHLMYIYYMLLFIFSASNVLLSNHYMLNCFNFVGMLPSFLSDYNNFGLPSVANVYVRLGYFIILSHFLNKFVRGHSPLHHKALHHKALVLIQQDYGRYLLFFWFFFCF